MQTTIRPEEMKTLEQDFMQERALPSALLMEHAAQGVCAAILRHVPQNARVLFLCGSGNNGGDGYAAARLWHHAGGTAFLLETGTPRGDAAMNRTLAKEAGVVFLSAFPAASAVDAIVDALFGTGLNRAPEGITRQWIDAANNTGLPIIAVDIPSGLDGDTGIAPGAAIHAAETVTFHRIKQGLLLRSGPEYSGTLTVHPILIPAEYGSLPGLDSLDPEDITAMLPPRPVCVHKGAMGRVVILAGSEGMAGAAALCAQAAIKAGAGLTRILCRAAQLPILQMLVPGATCTVLPDEETEAADTARTALSQADAAAIGPGIGTNEALLPLLQVFAEADCPVVWDADALNLLSENPELLPLAEKDVITPHPGEAARLLQCSVSQITKNPLTSLEALHVRCGCITLLKGARTLMTDGERTAVNRFGSPAMAKGGSGDVLTGICAALLARLDGPADTLTTVQLAALIHGLAGARAAKQIGESNVLPQDLVQAIRF